VVGAFDLVERVRSAWVDRRQAWAFIERFVAGWHRPLAAGDGWSPAELETAIGHLAERFPAVTGLPAALAEIYLLLGHRADVTSNQDCFLGPTDLFVESPGGVLVARQENQGCAQWGIRLEDLGEDDPPVVMQIDGPQSGWWPYTDRWFQACVEMVLFESRWSHPDLHTDVELDEATAAVERQFVPLPGLELPH
jgi:hypothetical protein